jgi:hypothetical protein
VDDLERQNRRLKAAGLSVLTVFVSVLLLAQATPTRRTVEAQAFYVTDHPGGAPRALLSISGDGPALVLNDRAGVRRVTLALRDNGPHLDLADSRGVTRASLYFANLTPGQQTEKSGFPLAAVLPVPGWTLPLPGSGGPQPRTDQGAVSLDFYDAEGGQTAMLRVDSGAATFGLAGTSPKGKQSPAVLLNAGWNTSVLRLVDQEDFKTYVGTTNLESRETGKTSRTSAASIMLFSRDAQLWSAP